jgi:Na+/H+ antiporter NhaC
VLATSIGANLPLVIASVVGGSTFGDCSSPLSDIVVESAMGASVDVVDLGKAQFVPKAIMALITLAIYLVLGFVI